MSSRARRGFVSALAGVVLLFSLAGAAEPESDAPDVDCKEVRVTVSIQPLGREADVWADIVEESFEISVEVWNGCEQEVSIPIGEIVPYRTSFEAAVGEALQPSECVEGHVQVAGAVGPGQMLRQTQIVERCLSAAGAESIRRVQIDGGVLRTSGSPARFAPAELELR